MKISKKDGVVFLSAGVCVGFAIGFITALYTVVHNMYFQNHMFGIMAMCFKEKLNRWSISSVVICAVLIAAIFLWTTIAKYSRNIFEIKLKTKQTGKRLLIAWTICMFGALGYVACFSMTAKIHIAGVLSVCGIVPFIVLAIWICRDAQRKAHATLIYHFAGRIINRTALSLIFIIIVLNAALFFNRTVAFQKSPNIIMILIDCLRSDTLGCYGNDKNITPAIDQIARTGVVFKNAYSTAPWTKPSVASLLTGQYPNDHSVINPGDCLPNSSITLSEILKNSGYYTCYFNGGNFFVDTPFNFYQGFDFYRCSKVLRNAVALTDLFLSSLPKLKKQNFFVLLHYMDAHTPYQINNCTSKLAPQNSFLYTAMNVFSDSKYIKAFFTSFVRGLTFENKLLAEDKKYIKDIYDCEVHYIDEQIQRLFDSLKNTGLFENTVFIILADHGEEFWEHNNYEHGHTLYNELIKVPLIIAGKGIKPAEITTPVSLIDVFPTILDIVGVRNENLTIRGESLMEALYRHTEPTGRSLFSMGTLYGDEKYCLIDGEYKIIFNTGIKDTKKFDMPINYLKEGMEIYNLPSDPHEKEDLAHINGETFVALKKKLLEFKSHQSLPAGNKIIITDEVKENLKTLGYIQ